DVKPLRQAVELAWFCGRFADCAQPLFNLRVSLALFGRRFKPLREDLLQRLLFLIKVLVFSCCSFLSGNLHKQVIRPPHAEHSTKYCNEDDPPSITRGKGG